MTSSTPGRPDGPPPEEPPDRSDWTVPLGHSQYAPPPGPSSQPPPERLDSPPPSSPTDPPFEPPRSRPPGELLQYPPHDGPESETRPVRSHRAGDDVEDAPPSGGVLRHLLGFLVGLVLTPGAITLLTYGGYRYQRILPSENFDHDTRGLIALGAGAFVLLLVAASGAFSPVGPFVGSLWGLVPAGLYLLAPKDTVDLIADLPRVPDQARSGALVWLALGSFLAVGATLFGAFVASTFRRRRR